MNIYSGGKVLINIYYIVCYLIKLYQPKHVKMFGFQSKSSTRKYDLVYGQ